MSYSQRGTSLRSRIDLVRALRLTLWVGPGLMALVGIGYMLFEHQRHANDPGWLWSTLLGMAIFGFVGPLLSWVYLRWAIEAAEAYLESQKQLERRADELATLNQLSVAASRSLDLNTTIAGILEQTMEALDAEAGMVFVQEDGQPGLRLEAQRGLPTDIAHREAHLASGCGLCRRALETRQVLFSSDVDRHPDCELDYCICKGFRSAACTPLEVKGQLVGLLQLASPYVGHFAEDQRAFLATVARQVSTSIENAQLYDTVQAFNVELELMVDQRTRELELAREELAEKARQLQRLLGESYRIQEETRARIAHDMHDGVTQLVIGALYEAQAAREALPKDPNRAEASLIRAQQLLSEVEGEIRRVIYDLHPPVLDMMGLVVALKRFAPTYTAAFGIDCPVVVGGTPRRLSRETEISIYRIIQAALHNVATHAQAEWAQVRFDFEADRLQVVVEDDGVGFDPVSVISSPGEHLGLIGMKERAESLGANITVTSLPREGTQVKLILPVPDYLD
jgi:signal transduction histidine kinase